MTELTNIENRMVIDAYWRSIEEPSKEEYDSSDDDHDYPYPLIDEDEQNEPRD